MGPSNVYYYGVTHSDYRLCEKSLLFFPLRPSQTKFKKILCNLLVSERDCRLGVATRPRFLCPPPRPLASILFSIYAAIYYMYYCTMK